MRHGSIEAYLENLSVEDTAGEGVNGEFHRHTRFDIADIGFVDEANGNFDLKADSCVFADIPGFVRPPYEKFGLTE